MTFDRLAPHYRWIERLVFGDSLQRCRVAMLDRLPQAKRVLIVGEGDGRFLVELLKRMPEAEVHCLDISQRMLELAGRRADWPKRVTFQIADIRTEALFCRDYDLIVTNFLIDCFEEGDLRTVIDRLSEVLTPGGLWIIGDFRLPTKGAARRRAAMQLAIMYAAFRIATRLSAGKLVDPVPILIGKQLELIGEKSWQNGFLSAQLWRNNP